MQRVRQTTTVKKSYAVIGIIPFVVERRGRKHTATVLADGTVFIIPKKTAEAVFLFTLISVQTAAMWQCRGRSRGVRFPPP